MTLAALFFAKHPRRSEVGRSRPKRPRSHRSRVVFETLENRLLLSANLSLFGIPDWVPEVLGPIVQGQVAGMGPQSNPVAGAVNVIAPHRTDADVVYVGTVNGGVWKTNTGRWPSDGVDNDNDGHADLIDTNADSIPDTADPGEETRWFTTTDQYPSLSIGALAFSPLDPVTLTATNETLFAGIGSFSSSHRGGLATGLLMTRDGGSHWAILGEQTFDSLPVTSIVPTSLTRSTGNPVNPLGQVVLAATLDGPSRQGGVFRSLDGGQYWTRLSSETGTLPLGSVTDLEADPGNASRFYAALPGAGLYKTDDAGDHWVAINNISGASVGVATTTRIELSVSPVGTNPVYAGLIVPFGGPTRHRLADVLRSDDYGANWTAIQNLPPVHGQGRQAQLHFSILADRLSDHRVFIGGDRQAAAPFVGDLYRGNSADNTWTSIVLAGASGTAPHADSRYMVFDHAGDLLQADDGGVYRLLNPGGTAAARRWESLTGNLGITEFYSVAWDSVNDTIIGGTQDVGVAEQVPGGGDPWFEVSQGDGGIVAVDPTTVFPLHYSSAQQLRSFTERLIDRVDNNGNILVDDFNEGMRPGFAVQGTATLGALPQSLTARDAANRFVFDRSIQFVNPWALNSVDRTRMLIGTNFLYESTDRGATLMSLGGLLNQNADTVDNDNDGSADAFDGNEFVPTNPVGRVTAIAYGGHRGGEANADVAYVAVGGRDGRGQTWPARLLLRTERSATVGVNDFRPTAYRGGTIRDIAVDPDDWHRVYAVDSASVFVTEDAGASWKEIGGLDAAVGLPLSRDLRTIELVRRNGHTIVLVGSRTGVYRAVDPVPGHVAVWTEFGADLPNAPVTDLHYDGTDNVLLVGTRGRGAWTIPNADAALAVSGVLRIDGDAGENHVRLARNEFNPSLLDIFINDVFSRSVQMSTLERIEVHGGAGNDSLTIDVTNGVIALPAPVHFAGGADLDAVMFTGTTAALELVRGPQGPGQTGEAHLTHHGEHQVVTFEGVDGPPSVPPLSRADLMPSLRIGLQQAGQRLRPTGLAQAVPPFTSIAAAFQDDLVERDPIRDPGPEDVAVLGELQQRTGPLFQRLIETGLGAFSLADIGATIDTPEALRARLDGLDDIDGNVVLTDAGGVLRYDGRIEKTIRGTAEVETTAVGGVVSLSGVVELAADVALDLHFGVDDRGFFVDAEHGTDPEIVFENFRVDGEVSAEGRFGFLEVTLSDTTVAMDPDVRLSVDLHDTGPDPFTGIDDGLLRSWELGVEADDVADVTLTGNPDAADVVLGSTFEVSPVVADEPAPFGLGSAAVEFIWADVTDPSTIEVRATTEVGEELLNFLNVTPQQVLAALHKVHEGLDTARDWSVMDREIPFAGDTTLGDLVDAGDAFVEGVIDVLESNGETQVFTVQDLLARLPAGAGVEYDALTRSLLYRFSLAHRFNAFDVPVDLSTDIGGLAEIETESAVTVAPSLELDLAFGVDLSALIDDDTLAHAFFITDTSLSGVVAVTADDIDASASLGPLTVRVENGSGAAAVAITVPLVDPGPGAADGRITLAELTDALADPDRLVGSPIVALDGRLDLPVSADTFHIGDLSVELAGLVVLTGDDIDFSLSADVDGMLVPGVVLEEGSRVTFDDEDGLTIDALATVFGAHVHLTGTIDPDGPFDLTATANDVGLGPLTVDLFGTLASTGDEIDYLLTGEVQGELTAGLEIVEATVILGRDEGLEIDASAHAFGVDVHVTGDFESGGNFALTATTDPFEVVGATVTLAGEITRIDGVIDWELSADIADWTPAPLITVEDLHVTLDADGIGFETTADIAGFEGIHLTGDYVFATGTYRIIADAPLDWTFAGVMLSDVHFTITNRRRDGSAGDVRVGADAQLELFGEDFLVVANVTAGGFWVAATPSDPDWSPIAGTGLQLDYALLVVSTYEFVLAIEEVEGKITLVEILDLEQPQPDASNQRLIHEGVSLVASGNLPDNVPAFGGSEVQIAGVIGTSLPQMSIEASIVFDDAPVIADLLAFDSFGLRITGAPSLAIFGQGRILGSGSGLGQDIPIEAALTLDLLAGSLDGSLSLRDLDGNPDTPILTDVLIPGLDIYGGSASFGIVFGSPLPTVGLALDIGIPEIARDAFLLPARVSGAVKVSPTTPIVAFSFLDWQPFERLGIDLTVEELTVAAAPNGGSIGTRVFEPGFSAEFVADILGVDVHFLGLFDEETLGILLEGVVSEFDIAGIEISGNGPDGVFDDGDFVPGTGDPDEDNGVTFSAGLTPTQQALGFSGRVELPGTAGGAPAFLALDANFDVDGLFVDAHIANWEAVPAILRVEEADFELDVPFDDFDDARIAFDGTVKLLGGLLGSTLAMEGEISGEGIAFAGSVHGGNFGGIRIEEVSVGFSTLPGDELVAVDVVVDLPGAGGRTEVHGSVADTTLTLDAAIDHWTPVPFVTFDGTLHAEVALATTSLELDFDVHTSILGQRSDFTGSLSASPGSFALDAIGTIHLAFVPGGPSMLNLGATIDIGRTDAFAIGLSADFPLPGFRAGTAHLSGAVDSGGFSLAGSVDDWELLPLLYFNGSFALDVDLGAQVVTANLAVGTHLLSSTLELHGEVIASGGEFKLVLDASMDLSIPGVISVELVGTLDTRNGLFVQMSGEMEVFGEPILDVSAKLRVMSAKGSPEWRLDVGMALDLPELKVPFVKADIGYFSVDLDLEGGFSIGDDLSDLSVTFAANVDVTLKALGRTFTEGFHNSLTLDAGTGKIVIPDVRPVIHLSHTLPWKWHPLHWRNLEIQIADPPGPPADPPTTTVTAVRSGDTVIVRGGATMERVEIHRERTTSPKSIFGRTFKTPVDKIVVRGANGEDGEWVEVLKTSAVGLARIDIDVSGSTALFGKTKSSGDDIDISRSVQIATIVHGGRGDDTISGGSGNDTIFGGAGDDQISGNAGHDVIHGDAGEDAIDGGAGNDQLFGDADRDRLVGSEGADSLWGGADTDDLQGDAGNDALFGEGGADRLTAGAGDDALTGGADDDVLDGGTGNDRVVLVADVAQTLTNARLIGFDEDVLGSIELASLTGGGLDNVFDLSGWSGAATVDGGAGVDTIVAMRNADFTLDATTLSISSGGQASFTSVERVRLTGGPGANRLDASGFTGQASLFGRAGNDILLGGSGADVLDGGSGFDSLAGNGGDDELRGGGGAHETLVGGAGDDVMLGSDDGADVATGGEGRDRLLGHGGNDSLSGGAGDDTVDGGAGDDLVQGEVGVDLLLGGIGHDTIHGHGGAGPDDGAVDFLYGDLGTAGDETGSGGDRLFGAGGNDLFFGEGGDDFVDAGATFGDYVRFGSGESDVPADFVPSTPTPAPPLAAIMDGDAVPEPPVGIIPAPGQWAKVGLLNLAIMEPVFLGETYYVNDATADVVEHEDGSQDTIAAGSSANDGLSRSKPKASVQQVLDAYDLEPLDRIAVYSGSYGSFTVGAGDSGVRIAGASEVAPTIAGILINGASGVTIQDFTVTPRITAVKKGLVKTIVINQAITVSAGTNVTVARNVVDGGISVSGGTTIKIVDNEITPRADSANSTGIVLTGGVNGVQVEENLVETGSRGIAITGPAVNVAIVDNDLVGNTTGLALLGAASGEVRGNEIDASGTGLAVGAVFTGAVHQNDIDATAVGVNFLAGSATLEDNLIHGVATGLAITGASSGWIAGNDISAGTTALDVAAAFGGTIARNDVHGSPTGVRYAAAAALSGNMIHANAIGVRATVSDPATAFGFVGGALPNQIYANTTGVSLAGRMQDQHVFANTIGVVGSGILGGQSLEHANLVETNDIGVSFQGTVQANRIARNRIGIDAATTGQLITGNLIYRNSEAGVLIDAAAGVDVVGNTFYATVGDNVRLSSGSHHVALRNNILWSEQGYDLFVADDSRTGFSSDANDLYATDAGRLVRWSGTDYTDLLDWRTVSGFDVHSLGTTAARPEWSAPRFVNRAHDDYAVFDLVAGQRWSSPTIDALGATAGMGAYGSADGGRDDAGAPRVALRFPDLSTDWGRADVRPIRWQTYGDTNGAPVRLDLYQDTGDGPAFLTTIVAETPDDGEFAWAPKDSDVDFGAEGLRIQASVVGFDTALDRSTESFSVPEGGAPSAGDDAYDVDEDGTLEVSATLGVLADDSDADGDPLTAQLVSGPEHGTLELAADGSFTYTPAPDFDGTDRFTYVAHDGSNPSAVATVLLTVHPVNDAPVAADDSYEMDENTVLRIDAPGVLANDADIDADPLGATQPATTVGPQHGVLSLDSAGAFTYTPDPNFSGTDSFTYVAVDSTGATDSALVTITVLAVNDPPVVAPIDDVDAVEGTPVVVQVEATDADGAVAYSLVEAPEGAAITAGGLFTWTPADGDATATVTIRVTDDGTPALSVDETFVVAVADMPPALSLSGPDQVIEGDVYTLALAADDPGDDHLTEWQIAWGDGTTEVVPGDATFATHVYAEGPQEYAITAQATDEDGTYDADPLIVVVQNAAPVVDAGADLSAVEGTTLALESLFHDAATLDTHTATIDWGDGTTADVGVVTESPYGPPGATAGADGTVAGGHVYADDGFYTVTVTVTDDDGGIGVDTLVVTVSNVAPTLDAGADVATDEGAVVTLASVFHDAGTLDTHAATIDWGDGTITDLGVVTETPFGPPGSTAGADGTIAGSHVYADNGAYTVTVSVTDDDGGTDTETLQVTVANVAPTLDAGADQTVIEGALVSLAPATFNDRGTLDTHTATINWGDGTATGLGVVTETPFGPPGSTAGADGTVAGSHVYADNGTYTVTVTVTDDDGAETTDTLDVTVLNVAPTVVAGADQTLDEGAVVSLAPATFNDRGTSDTHTATINWGDGTLTELGVVSETPFGPPGSTAGVDGTIAGSHVYADNGTYTVTVIVTDDDGAKTTDTLEVTVLNVAPTLAAGADQAVNEGAVVSLAPATFNDPGTSDAHTATINWGDGTMTELGVVSETPFGPPGATAGADGTIAGSHVYADNGTYTVTVTVTDDDGGKTTDTLAVTVLNAAPTLVAGANQAVNEGAVVSLAPATFNDQGTLDSHTATINWGDGTLTEEGVVTETPFGPPGSTAGADGTIAGSHVYADNGTYTVTVIVTDDDGAKTTDTLEVTVVNVAPTIDAVAATPRIVEGDAVTLTGDFTDPGRVDTFTLFVHWGDGATERVMLGAGRRDFGLTHRYLDDDPSGTGSDGYDITLVLADDDGGSAIATTATIVDNAAPVANLAALSIGVRGQRLSFGASLFDLGIFDTHEVAWDFGDGQALPFRSSNDGDALAPTHIYASEGAYTLELVARDDDGGVTETTQRIVVDVAGLRPDPYDPTKTALVVGGTTGPDVVRFTPGGGTDGVRLVINDRDQGSFAPTGRIIVFGQAGDDDIAVAGSVRLVTELHGDAGNDRLKGGQGSSILLGGAGADELVGGSGRDLLIGGPGADRLVGGADDDILVAGTTVYDGDSRALGAILAEWTRADASYDRRVQNLLDGAGHAADSPLNASTAFDDAERDTLTGSAGDDWYFYRASGPAADQATDRHRAEGAVETAAAPATPTVRIDWSAASAPPASRPSGPLAKLWILEVLEKIERDALVPSL